MSITRSMVYGNRAIIDKPELPDYESESDITYIVKDKIIKETNDISNIIDSDNGDMSDVANNSETDKVKSKTMLVGKWNIEPPRRRKNVQQNIILEKKVFMQVCLFILLPLFLILF